MAGTEDKQDTMARMCQDRPKSHHSRRLERRTTQQHQNVGPRRQADLIGRKDGHERQAFHVAILIIGGEEMLFALAGHDGSTHLNFVEEWLEGSLSCRKAFDNLVERRAYFASLVLPRRIIC